MKFGSICSGIEAASVAWHPLGWRASFLSEIENFPRAVLENHYPEVPLHGDFTTITEGMYESIDLLVGGTPCQDFSVAGKRAGLDGVRGNLTLEYAELAKRLRPTWLVWENVPGVFSSNGGLDFGSVIACFAGYPEGIAFQPPKDGWSNSGIIPPANADSYGLAWRVLDAQFAGVPQRRRRVFVIGYLGDWRPAAAVLLERHSLQGHPAPRREARKDVAGTIGARTGRSIGAQDAACGHMIPADKQWPADVAPALDTTLKKYQGLDNQHINGGGDGSSLPEVSMCLNAGGMGRRDAETETLIPMNGGYFDVAPSLTCNGDAHSGFRDEHGLVPVPFSIMPMNSGKDYKARQVEVSQPIMAGGPAGGPAGGNQGGDYIVQPVAFALRGREGGAMPEVEGNGDAAGSLRAASGGSSRDYVAFAFDVQQITSKANCTRVGSELPASTLAKQSKMHAAIGSAVRRLTPRECERLQGFQDDYTLIPWRGGKAVSDHPRGPHRAECPDGPRYKALGNSMAVPVMAWIGIRIQMVIGILEKRGCYAYK